MSEQQPQETMSVWQMYRIVGGPEMGWLWGGKRQRLVRKLHRGAQMGTV